MSISYIAQNCCTNPYGRQYMSAAGAHSPPKAKLLIILTHLPAQPNLENLSTATTGPAASPAALLKLKLFFVQAF